MEPRWREVAWPAAVAFAVVALAGGFAGIDLDHLRHDAATYDALAQGLLSGHFGLPGSPHPEVFRSPGFPAVLAGLYQLFGRSALTVTLMQASLHAAGVALFWRLARWFLAPRPALGFAWALALFPYAVFGSLRLLTEPLTGAGIAGLLVLALKARAAPAGWRWAGVGAGLALLCLVRPSMLPWAALLAALVLRDRGWGAALRLTAALLLVAAPWAARNSALVGAPMGLGLGLGNGLWIASFEFRQPGRLLPQAGRDAAGYAVADAALLTQAGEAVETPRGQRALDQARGRAAAARIWAEPGVYLRANAVRALRFWLSYALDGLPPWARAASAAVCLLLLLGGGWGLWLAWRRVDRWLLAYLLSPVVALQLLHSVVHVEGRYSLPVRPILLLLFAYGLSQLHERARMNADHRHPTPPR